MSSSSASSSKRTKKISLKSARGKLFEVEEPVAMKLGIVATILKDNDNANENVVVPLLNVETDMLLSIVTYIRAHLEFQQRDPPPPREEVKALDTAFVEEWSNEKLKMMIEAANYLGITELLDFLTDVAARRIENKSVEYAREFFGIENDYTPDEEANLGQEYEWAFEGIDED